MVKSPTKPLIFKTYISRIKKAVGSKMFQNFFMKIGNKEMDILNNGNLSCAMFVSSVLYLSKLIFDFHTTVSSTIKDMEKSGWYKIKKPKIGAVLVWEPQKLGNDVHAHIGFYISNNKAISNSSRKKTPQIHHYLMENNRKIIAIYWNKKLN